MVTNFESITTELTDYELSIVPAIIAGFKRYSKESPIKSADVVERFNNYNGSKILTDARLRKIVNHIRTNGLLPLIATSNGYYVSHDRDEILKQIESLEQRSRSIENCAKGLKRFV